jgi:glutamate synthase domain-containing protein 3
MGDVRLAEDPHVDDMCGPNETVRLRPRDRAVGARIASEIVAKRASGQPIVDQVRRYTGSAGQSFGAFLTAGLRLELDGDANDYVGKSMEGGTVVVRAPGPPDEASIGNACFYGARGGDAYITGTAGERLAVRNSGGTIVVEGAGAHACEYMTAGTVVVLGPVGRNAASGMSGGEAFFLASEAELLAKIGPTELRPHALDAAAIDRLHALIVAHADATGSARATALLAEWPAAAAQFVRLAPGAPVPEAPTVPAEPAVSVPSPR